MQILNLKQLAVVASATAAVFVMAGQGTARAQAGVQVAGTTTGIFGVGSPTSPSTLLGLTFTGSSFNDTTDESGFVAFGGTSSGGPNFNNFGTISLNNAANSYNGQAFTLKVSFSAPGMDSTLNTASLRGSVRSTGSGGVTFDFDNNPVDFVFSSPTIPNGKYTLRVADVSVNSGQTATITGDVTVQSVPELSTVTGMGSLLAGGGLTMFGGVIRRRRKNGTLAA